MNKHTTKILFFSLSALPNIGKYASVPGKQKIGGEGNLHPNA
ncbi:hypothetical protein TF3313_1638 [Tannerella forsythia 3313]|nr:hypothetical protein TF3313_1638 [Tannerella forsythia 3313]